MINQNISLTRQDGAVDLLPLGSAMVLAKVKLCNTQVEGDAKHLESIEDNDNRYKIDSWKKKVRIATYLLLSIG